MDSLAIAFIAVVVGSLLYIQLQLHQIGKNLKPKDMASKRNTKGE